jgi:short-subunit dehydrogenase involved in D-alanine esterification of teichoic acids
MKIGITGHTSGLGEAIYNILNDTEVKGFSRNNGYDITTPQSIIDEIENYDIFINNAYSGFSQVNILYDLYEKWKNEDKKIINISSNSSDGIKTKSHIYAIHKSALDKASEQLHYDKGVCKVINVRPGWIDTPRVKHITATKMNSYTLGRFIVDLIYNDLNIKEITINV